MDDFHHPRVAVVRSSQQLHSTIALLAVGLLTLVGCARIGRKT